MSGHRTAQGKTLDMATLAAKNEKVRAVGNMNVNARGDVLDNNNNIVNNNTNRVKSQYRNTVAPQKPASQAPESFKPTVQNSQGNVPLANTVSVAPAPTIQVDEPVELSKEEQELFDNDEDIQK